MLHCVENRRMEFLRTTGVGAICDPAAFSGVVEVARGVPNDKLCFCASSTTPSFASNNAGLPGRFCAVLNCAAQ